MLQRYYGLACLAVFAGVLLLGGCQTPLGDGHLSCDNGPCLDAEIKAQAKFASDPVDYDAIFGPARVGNVTAGDQ